MNDIATGTENDGQPDTEFAGMIRTTLDRLAELDRETSGYLKTLAFVLHRVAIADHVVTEDEVERMERILIDHASISRPEAILAVEIARHCGEIADCGCSYAASRDLRSRLDQRERLRIRGFLDSVAEADGLVRPDERAAIRQITVELGLDRPA